MFNLLRRRVRRKHKNNKNKYNIDASATDAVQSGNDNVPKYCYTKDENGEEHYRQISEKNDEQQPTAAEIALANVGASITGKTSKTTRNGEYQVDEDNEENLHINDVGKTFRENSAISAGKIYFENARDKKRYLKQVKNNEKQEQQQQQWQTNDKQVHLPQTTDNFSFDLNEDAVAGHDDDDDHHHYHLEKPYAEVDTQIAKNEQRQQDYASSSKKVEDVSYDCSACGFSHNEIAERQRCVLTIGEYDEILLNRTNRPTTITTTTTSSESENQLNNIVAFKEIAKDNKNSQQINFENVHNINSYKCKTAKTTAETNEKISTINNEVKYRNLDKTSRNEAKRQSRLSFTLAGINFGRKKEVDDRVKNDQDNNEQNNFSKVGTGIGTDTGIGIEVVAEPVVNNQTKINESNCKKNKLNPFKKSREYFNNLFMARGRQQNRHQRHQQQQQQQLVSKQQHNKNDTAISRTGGGVDKTKIVDKTQMTSSSKNDVNATLHLNVTDSTNSYQIPLSKNNTIHSNLNPNQNQNQKEVSAHKNRERELSRSNSATYARTHSLSPQLSTKRSRSVTFSDVDHIIEDGRDFWLNKNVEKFSRTGNIERGSSNLANNTANDQFAQESNNNNTFNTHGVVGTEGVEFPTTSAFEHTHNNHYNQTSSHTTNEYNNYNNNNRNNQEIDKDKGNESKDLLYTNKLYQIDNNKSNASTPTPQYKMGQTNTKSETPTRDFRESSVSSTTSERDRVKKVSFANLPETASSPININLPTITVADYSEALSSATTTPSDQEVFYDTEQNDRQQQYINDRDRENYTMTVDNDIEHDANYYIGAGAQSMSMNDHQYNNNNKWQMPNNVFLSQPQMRHNYVKLEDVREEDENEDEENNEEEPHDETSDADDDDADEEESDFDEKGKRPRHLDNELYNSTERSPLKSSDTTLSGSPSDSGIGTDSQPATPSNVKSRHSPNSFYPNSAATTTTTSSDIRNETSNIQQLKQQIKQQYGFMSFVRDGNSTDCDEIPLHYDDIDLDLADDDSTNERLVCIESISLPDVVVESTAATSSSTTLSSASSSTTSSEHIINITSGASGNSMGNVHFIPIHVEGASNGGTNATKRRSSDDSVIGNGTIEITEDASVMNGHVKDNRQNEKLKRELAEQKSRFDVQLEGAQKSVQSLQSKVSEMQMKIEKLEQELSTKAWNVERLQGELGAAQKDDDYVRKKLKLLEDEKTALRHKYSENEDEFRRRYEELETQYKELEEKYKQTQHLASNLQTQLAMAQSEAEEWRQEVEKIRVELEEQIRVLKNALEYSEAERKICADKWQREFEMLRTQHQDREESLMTDCEWQLRQMQKQCKDKMDKSDFLRQEAAEKATRLEAELTERQRQVNHLRQCQAEVKSLRGVVTEQESSIRTLMAQIDNLKAELQTANDNLLTQMETVEKIKFQCNNALCDKERQMIYRIDEVRNEAAAFWEDKLYTEMTRLKNELESVYVDERREALDKLQDEHIEELRHLTNRYTLNEEELRAELHELQERLDQKNAEFLELREKSDNALLQTRMHLDRADREYQNAMCREEQRREDLEAKLNKEFSEEKQVMEQKFEKRLAQAKETYAKELQIATANLSEKHKKELEQQKVKLMAERDEAIQELTDRHRQKLIDAEERMKDIELRHQRNLKDLKATYDTEKAALDKRDISNANEIEQLHRKCRCLTNLFEEMRMRYERRDPRQEDLREIAELRSRCESQERDLYLLTDRLREMQIQMGELQENGVNHAMKSVKKPLSKTLPTNCDVIYEENEERESPTPNDSETEEIDESEQQKKEITNKNIDKKGKNFNTINEDDSMMVSAV